MEVYMIFLLFSLIEFLVIAAFWIALIAIGFYLLITGLLFIYTIWTIVYTALTEAPPLPKD